MTSMSYGTFLLKGSGDKIFINMQWFSVNLKTNLRKVTISLLRNGLSSVAFSEKVKAGAQFIYFIHISILHSSLGLIVYRPWKF